jgi:magnesium-transporting ATPase (P-type)
MQSLKKLLHPSAKVIRDGKLIEELSENLVP